MGINSGTDFMYISAPLEWKHVELVARERARIKEPPQQQMAQQRRAMFDIDASNIGFRTKGSAGGAVHGVMKCARACAQSGFESTVSVDGQGRHSSKRASSSRLFQREANRLKSFELERRLSAAIQAGNDKDATDLAKKLNTIRKAAQNTLPSNFHDLLETDCKQSGHIYFKVSETFQADPIIGQSWLMRRLLSSNLQKRKEWRTSNLSTNLRHIFHIIFDTLYLQMVQILHVRLHQVMQNQL